MPGTVELAGRVETWFNVNLESEILRIGPEVPEGASGFFYCAVAVYEAVRSVAPRGAQSCRELRQRVQFLTDELFPVTALGGTVVLSGRRYFTLRCPRMKS